LGVPLPVGVVYDGKDMSNILFDDKGESLHDDGLFFYGGAGGDGGGCPLWRGPSAMRFGKYKVHFSTGPGLSGCFGCKKKCYCSDPKNGDCEMLLFDIRQDPSEAYPLDDVTDVKAAVLSRLQSELATFTYGKLVAPPDQPGEGPNKYGVCCDRSKECDCSGPLPGVGQD
jgi:hypothetical protein